MLENAQTQGGLQRVLTCPCVFSPSSEHGHHWAGALPPEARSGQTLAGQAAPRTGCGAGRGESKPLR